MEIKEETRLICRMIERLIRSTINPKWCINLSGAVGFYIEVGVKSLSALYHVPEIDNERVVDYIVYQVYRNRNAIERGTWNIGRLFSDVSKDNFRKQFLTETGKSGMNYYIDLWLDEAELSRSKLTQMISKPKPSRLKSMVYMENEEPIKKRFLNLPEGLVLCQTSTTGWSPLSECCNKCDNRVQCKEITAKKYPELMRHRNTLHNG